MLTTLAVANYRSLLRLTAPLGQLNVITGPNASGKSNLYRALRLLAETAQAGVVRALAAEGGLSSTIWAGPERFSREMLEGSAPVQGGPRSAPVRLRLGFGGDDFGYAISLGLPQPSRSAFGLDPEIKREAIWAGPLCRPAAMLVERKNAVVKFRAGREWQIASDRLSLFDSMFSEVGGSGAFPLVTTMRDEIRGWRFYDSFRADRGAPARMLQVGTRTPVLSHDGGDLAAALQTIIEIGDEDALRNSVADAFPGARLEVEPEGGGRLAAKILQDGLLRPLAAEELSDGTLRYLLWIAALLTPRPPRLMVLNEPETSLHTDLLPALARLIVVASQRTQMWVVSHSALLVAELRNSPACRSIELQKILGQTRIVGLSTLDEPPWEWPD